MCAGSPPPPPDYEGAAEATSAGNLDMARLATEANRPDQFTPFGSIQWTNTPTSEFDQGGWDTAMEGYTSDLDSYNQGLEQWGTTDSEAAYGGVAPAELNRADFTREVDNWSSNVEFSPEMQELFNLDVSGKQLTGEMGIAGLEAARGIFDTPFSVGDPGKGYQGPGAYGEHRQGVVDAMMSRVNTDVGRDRETISANLIAQGIPKGSEAYNREMEQLDRKQTDARQRAELAAESMASTGYSSALAGSGQDYTMSEDSRRQGIKEALLERTQPLNEYSAFMSGNQVGMPQFGNVPQQQTVPGTDYTGAATAQGGWDLAGWNADQGGKNNMLGGLFDLGSSYISGGYLK